MEMCANHWATWAPLNLFLWMRQLYKQQLLPLSSCLLSPPSHSKEEGEGGAAWECGAGTKEDADKKIKSRER
jgi:hypothetical protein